MENQLFALKVLKIIFFTVVISMVVVGCGYIIYRLSDHFILSIVYILASVIFFFFLLTMGKKLIVFISYILCLLIISANYDMFFAPYPEEQCVNGKMYILKDEYKDVQIDRVARHLGESGLNHEYYKTWEYAKNVYKETDKTCKNKSSI